MRRVLLSAVLLLIPSVASADIIIDQQNSIGNTDLTITASNGSPGLYQSFTPSLNSIDFATFSLGANNIASTYRVNVRDGDGAFGSILGTSDTVTLNTFSTQTTTFNFAAPIDLTPGLTYTLHVAPVSGSNSALLTKLSFSNPYSGGLAYNPSGSSLFGGQADLIFSEGINVDPAPEPEPVPGPASITLMGTAAVLGLGFMRRRQQG